MGKQELDIRVDPEFQALIPPLTEKEFKQLRENILEVGEVYDPLITWQGILIDGHNRWKIIQENPEIRYTCIEVVFVSRNEAILWIINNQLGRRNLNKADAILLAQKRGEVIAEEAKAKQSAAGGDKRSEAYKETASVKNDKSETAPIDTRKEVAKLAGVSTGTVAQFEQVQKKAPELVDKIRAGEMTIGGAYKEIKKEESDPATAKTSYLPKPPEYTIDNLIKEIESSGDNYIRFLRDKLAEHSTLYSETDEKSLIFNAVLEIKSKIESVAILLK